MNDYIDVLPEVAEALSRNLAVVALESTIITHGMPYPRNVECAKTCEEIIRANGAVPATIAILGGRIKIGLTQAQLEQLACCGDAVKCSRRDLPYILATGKNGATTVAATMILSALAGIRFFATGGIGGVHRGAESSMDISADLLELAETGVCVISAGIKSILDVGRTLEYLETLGVPVAAYRQDAFPDFYTADSGYAAPIRLDSPAEAAEMMRVKWALGLKGGAIIANPIPQEYAMDKDEIDAAICAALDRASECGITGKDITPFLLSAIEKLTEGRSLEANVRLVCNNASLAAQIAAAYYM